MIVVVPDEGFVAWREQARELAKRGVPPASIDWRDVLDGPQETLLFDDGAQDAAAPPLDELRVPRAFVALAQSCACHRDPKRWSLLYELLWRLARGEHELLGDPLDPCVATLRRMDRAVHRDLHKAKAFVRFRRVVEPDGGERYVAFHRPDHRIVERIAPFFVGRFSTQRWSLLTPDRCAHWDGAALAFTAGVAERGDVAEDEVEALWTTYYANVFNPARLNVRAMKREMPVRHWRTLPEAALIDELVRGARPREAEMIARQPDPYPTARAFLPRERDLASLRGAASTCQGCPLHADATQTVFGEGSVRAPLVLVGEQPGDQEDREGRPFVGPAGELLDAALREAGVDRAKTYVTNAVKHFRYEVRGKRRIHSRPTRRMITACQPWVEAELAAITPELVVCLGAIAAEALLGTTFRLTKQRGKLVEASSGLRVLATFHPAAILRAPDEAVRAQMRQHFVADLAAALAACPSAAFD